MIQIIKKKIIITEELKKKIIWACTFAKVKPKIIEGNLRIIDKTNIAYVEPHRVLINNKIYLFFNEFDYFYIGNLTNKFPLSKLKEQLENNWCFNIMIFRINVAIK